MPKVVRVLSTAEILRQLEKQGRIKRAAEAVELLEWSRTLGEHKLCFSAWKGERGK